MKRIGLGIGIVLLIILSVTLFLGEKEQKQAIDLDHLQKKVTQQLTQMQGNGFDIQERQVHKEKEHFFITIVDPKQASAYLAQRGFRMTPQEADELKEIKFSVDLLYLSDTYSLDIYPVELPAYLKSDIKEESILEQLEALVKKKTFLMHVDMDHSGSAFKGYIKDIDASLQAEKAVRMKLLGLRFAGEIKEEKIVKFEQSFKHAHLYISDEINRTVSGLQSSYALTGPTMYDYTSQYRMDQIEDTEETGNTLFAEALYVDSTSKVENGLAKETFKATIKNVDTLFEKEKIGFKTLLLDMNISNIDAASLDKLQNIEKKEEKEIDSVIETFVAKNMHLTISNLSAQKVVLRGKEMGGFDLHADLDIDHSLDIYRLNIQPKYALKKISGKIHLSLSKEILSMLKEDGEFMILYMMYRPKRQLGQRIYDIHIGDGEIKINGKKVDF